MEKSHEKDWQTMAPKYISGDSTYSAVYAFRIKQLCEERKISINKLATLSGVKQTTIDNIIHGVSKNPTTMTMHKIAKGFGMSFSEFIDFPMLNDYLTDTKISE